MFANDSLQARLTEHATAALRAGRFAEVLPLVERLSLLAAPPVETACMRAEALLGLERLPEAEQSADLALAERDEPGIRRLRARIRLAGGDAAGAADDAAAAVMAAPGERAAKSLLGTCLLDLDRNDEALFFLGEAAAIDDPPSLLELARGFARSNRPEAAAELLAHCAAEWPDLPGLPGTRAQAALLARRPAEAEAILQAAIARGGPSPSLLTLLGHALIAQQRMGEGGAALEAAARLAPADGYLAHLAAAASAAKPDGANADYVNRLFDGYARGFEASLVSLGYRVPGLMLRAVQQLRPAAPIGPVLDLGCGTGLIGVVLDDLLPPRPERVLVGVDLSRRMLEQAAVKRIYTSLRRADLKDALAQDPDRYALVTAADVFCYAGRLDPLLALCRARLAPDGLLLFSIERAGPEVTDWQLGRTGRFAHAPEYVRQALAAAGLLPVFWHDEALRLDGLTTVEGCLIGAIAAPIH